MNANRIDGAFARVFGGGGALLLAVLIGSLGVGELQRWKETWWYIEGSGVVREVGVDIEHGKYPSYISWARVDYEVRGVRYSQRLGPMEGSTHRSAQAAKQAAARLKPGDQVKVWYSPSEPHRAFLDITTSVGSIALTIVALTISVALAIASALFFAGRWRPDSGSAARPSPP